MPTFDSKKAAAIHRELHSHLPSDPALRVKTLESLAVERGLVVPESVDAWIEAYGEHIGPKRGAQVVARAWCEPAYRERLLANAAEAVKDYPASGHGLPLEPIRRTLVRRTRAGNRTHFP